jgi:hypothetical protein
MPCADRPRAHKAEGEGVEPPRLIARPLSRRMPSPVGLTFRKGCGGRNRTCVKAVNSRLPVPARDPPQSKSGRPELNRRSRAPGARGIPGFPTSCSRRAPSGSRTRTSAMARRQAAATSWARSRHAELSKIKSTGRESNPRRRVTSAVSSPLDDQCLLFKWGRWESNPHPPV